MFPCGSKADGLVPSDTFLCPKALSKMPTWCRSVPRGQTSRAHSPTNPVLPFLLDLTDAAEAPGG